jgi:nickel transport protein
MMRALVLTAALAVAPLPALAHKVIASVFPSGQAIEGEIGFSNGDMAVDKLVTVYDSAGTKLGETRTDEDGFFLFTPENPVEHVFRSDLGAGHLAEVSIPAEEVAEILGVAAAAPVVTEIPVSAGGAVTVAALSQAERDAIATIVRNEMRPLRREIASYKEKNDLQTILGGIGYILGLFGVGFYLAANRKLKQVA